MIVRARRPLLGLIRLTIMVERVDQCPAFMIMREIRLFL
jgi:hypothetical protein